MTTKVNTTEIGDNFESKSLNIIKKVIEEEQLGHLAKHLKIFSKKRYYSNLRKKNIKFDLTIEVWPPGANRYVIIYIIECKDYDKRVPVDDIEEFHHKIQQVSGVNVKGIFISNSPLQEGGFNIAESVGMMVIQGESSDDFKIVLHKTNRNRKSNKIPFINETLDIGLIDAGSEQIEKLVDKKILGILYENLSKSHVSYNIDKLSKKDIEQIVNKELNKVNPKILSEAKSLSSKSLINYVQDELNIRVVDIEFQSNLLGTSDIRNSNIGLNKTIKGTNRELFILAHELGHFILHQKLSIGQTTYDAFEDSEYNFRTDKYDLTNPKHWIEWQANYFASSLVLPKVPFLARVYRYQDILNKSRGKIYLDDQYQNRKDFSELIKRLSYFFNVSKTTVIYKLNEMGLINDQSRLKPIGQIISEYKLDLFT